MANIERKNQKIFAKNSPKLGQFGSAIANTRVVSGDVEVLQELPAYEEGWDKAIITKKNYPTWQEMDGVQYGLSYQIAYLLQHGIPEWHNKQEYSLNSFCTRNGKIFISQINENIGNDPEQTNSAWKEFSSGAGLPVGTIVTSLAKTVKNGLACTGGEYSKTQFPTFYQTWLIGNLIPTITYDQYQTELTMTGECWNIAIDRVRETFKVPTIKKTTLRDVQNNTSATVTGSGTIPVKGDGKVLGLHNGGTNVGILGLNNAIVATSANSYGASASGTGSLTNMSNYSRLGVTTDPAKSGMIADLSKGNLKANLTGLLKKTTQELNYFVIVATGSINQSEMDWSAWASGLDGKVNKTGDTMTGVLNLKVAGRTQMLMQASEIDANVNPSQTAYGGYVNTYDNKGVIIGSHYMRQGGNGRLEYKWIVKNAKGQQVDFGFGIETDGTPFYVKPQIIQTYVKGTSGYRIWSDDGKYGKYCEQWGITNVKSDQTVDATLLKSLKDTNYMCQGTIRTSFGIKSDAGVAVYPIDTTKIRIICGAGGGSGTFPINWYICGYTK